MSRQLRRVPLGFDWPLNKRWWGFVHGVRTRCGACVNGVASYESKYSSKRGDGWSCEVCDSDDGYVLLPDVDPPEGEAYQLWEEVSEGSPISPPFATPEELADWLVSPDNDTSVTQGTTREQWLAFIHGPGWAPTAFSVGSGAPKPGVQL